MVLAPDQQVVVVAAPGRRAGGRHPVGADRVRPCGRLPPRREDSVLLAAQGGHGPSQPPHRARAGGRLAADDAPWVLDVRNVRRARGGRHPGLLPHPARRAAPTHRRGPGRPAGRGLLRRRLALQRGRELPAPAVVSATSPTCQEASPPGRHCTSPPRSEPGTTPPRTEWSDTPPQQGERSDASTGRHRPGLHHRHHAGPRELSRLAGRQLGSPVQPPRRLHSGVHHRAREGGPARRRVRAARYQDHRPVGRFRRVSPDLGERHRLDPGGRGEVPDHRRRGPARVRALRHDPPEREPDGHRALAVRHRRGQAGQADPGLPDVDGSELRRDPARARQPPARRPASGRHTADWQPGQDVIVGLGVSDEQAAEEFPGYRTIKPYLRFTTEPAA